jgi:hypothetical protein
MLFAEFELAEIANRTAISNRAVCSLYRRNYTNGQLTQFQHGYIPRYNSVIRIQTVSTHLSIPMSSVI